MDSLLHKAATFNREHFSSRLIELGIEVNSTNKVGSTPHITLYDRVIKELFNY